MSMFGIIVLSRPSKPSMTPTRPPEELWFSQNGRVLFVEGILGMKIERESART
jgi:hypothetical protein